MGGGYLDSDIKELMDYIESSSFVEFELEREGFKIKLVKRTAVQTDGPVPAMVAAPALPAAASAAPAAETGARPAAVAPPEGHVIKSPIVGTFYRANSPSARPFVEVGDRVKKGQVLCIVEAMKLMNEIESECDGEVLEVLVANGQPVEYGEPLFRVRVAAPA
jgi:acetyl-CoA carboxylase biotin carboxyl carrier protein